MDLTSITPGPEQLKALTHPVRVRMLGMLRIDGPATATMLATRLGLNTGATSYHLRQLAQHGFVVDDDSRGDRRERWWQAAHQSTRTQRPAPNDDAAQETLDAYLQAVVIFYVEQLQRAMEERPLLPAAWRDASSFNDWVITLTPARAKALVDTLAGVLEAAEEDEEDGTAKYVVQLNGFPLPGYVGGEEPGEDTGGPT